MLELSDISFVLLAIETNASSPRIRVMISSPCQDEDHNAIAAEILAELESSRNTSIKRR